MPEQAQKTFSFGGCYFESTSPKHEDIGPGTKCLNVRLTFEEALKLNLAVNECLRYLNQMKRSTTQGKRSRMNLAIYLGMRRVVVTKGQVRAKTGRGPSSSRDGANL